MTASSAEWAAELNADLANCVDVDDMVEQIFHYGYTFDGITIDMAASDANAKLLVSVLYRTDPPYPKMWVQWDGAKWKASDR